LTERHQQKPGSTGGFSGANGNGDVDARLVAQAQRELPYRTIAYEELMRRHQGLLFGVCRRLLDSEADAEDVCQEVMFKVFGGLKRFEGRSSFKTWLLRIATNTCNSVLDKRRRSQEIKAAWSIEQVEAPAGEIHTASLDVETLLARLNPDERQILTLRYVADLSIQEIAEVCDLGLSAAKMRLYRATDQLKALAGLDDQETS
jgi:RNA polymerase sigma-70 factor (ECF subfamily)